MRLVLPKGLGLEDLREDFEMAMDLQGSEPMVAAGVIDRVVVHIAVVGLRNLAVEIVAVGLEDMVLGLLEERSSGPVGIENNHQRDLEEPRVDAPVAAVDNWEDIDHRIGMDLPFLNSVSKV